MGALVICDAASSAVAVFAPEGARGRIARADAVIAYARSVKDWPTLEHAVDQKIEDQQAFVAWWRATMTPLHGAGRGKKNADRGSFSVAEEEDALIVIIGSGGDTRTSR